MKNARLFLFILTVVSSCNAFVTRRDTRHVTIEFNLEPKDKKQHLDWIEGVKSAIKCVNATLRKDGFLITETHPLQIESLDGWWKKISKYFTNLYYEIFFHQKAISYPGQLNRAFIVRRNDELGSFSVYIPDGIPEKLFLEVLKKTILQHGIDASVTPDQHVILTGMHYEDTSLGYPNLQGIVFSSEELQKFRKNSDSRSLQKADRKLLEHREANILSPDIIKKALLDNDALESKKEGYEIKVKKRIAPYLFWWQSIPTTGLRLEEPFWPLSYPFLPHAFPLWQMAPKMGNGIKVFIIDTGIAAFDIIGKPEYKRNQDLRMEAHFTDINYNLVSSERSLLDKTEQLAQLFEAYTDKSKRNFTVIENKLPYFITHYVSHYKDNKEEAIAPIKDYLLKNGRPEYIENKTKLSSAGEAALNDLVHGHLGIYPRNKKKPDYTLVTLGPPNSQQKAILEFIPLAVTHNKPFNLFASSSKQLDSRWVTQHTTGHGTHTAGIIGGLLHPAIEGPLNVDSVKELLKKDWGICGIAPKCDLVMIKAFKSSGFATNRSIITQAIKKAQEQGAQILNLSLKIDDHLDTTEVESKSLQRALRDIPYVAAASGNAQRNNMGVYQSDTEAYPARFSSIAFDAGAFVLYKNEEGDYHCHIPEFSQYQIGVGPKFLAPGQNILSCGLVEGQKESSMYMFLQGTSTAAPLLSGFCALLISEFEGLFESKEREKFLTICYSSTLKMEDSEDWKKKTILGVLDFRTVLFKLHVLKNLKTVLENKELFYTPQSNNKKRIKLEVEKDFERLCKAIHIVLFDMVHDFAKEQEFDDKNNFESNFMGYFNAARKVQVRPKGNVFNSFEKAVSMVTHAVLYGVDKDFVSSDKKKQIEQYISSDALKKVKMYFSQEKVDVLDHISESVKRRIKGVYGPKLK